MAAGIRNGRGIAGWSMCDNLVWLPRACASVPTPRVFTLNDDREVHHDFRGMCVLLLQDLLQSCGRQSF